ncbi:helix-hairpin-helix domain-containing protein [Companilactobacillus zhongbaensis]|uniref:helix-hairpin-helix domain-containing protein n=1 Tax=Companilactobacillus zhongbaensis TaxID=2486009 RepID=UPI000F78C07E|nr:helix-hairpin-helix domain-containing protein [Companilactobacillus zhongbaensis]
MEVLLEKIKQFKVAIIVVVLVIGGAFLYKGFYQRPTANQANVVSTSKKSTQQIKKTKSSTKPLSGKHLTVDIQGAVNNPGVYHLKEGAIVYDVIQTAGGMRDDADVKQINRAQKVTDAMQIYIPINGEVKTVTSPKGADPASGSQEMVNLNSATVEDLQKVKGIGPKKAEKIVTFREQKGPFKKIEDLTKVGGFGTKTIDTLRDSLTI